ncbi:hypothetical protein L249_4482, partial [Ophiocordyceps polyrhachis-furcata BCC 54312]
MLPRTGYPIVRRAKPARTGGRDIILAGSYYAKLARTSRHMHVDPARIGYTRDLPRITCPSRRSASPGQHVLAAVLSSLGQIVLVDVSSLGHVILAGDRNAKLARTSRRIRVDPARTGYPSIPKLFRIICSRQIVLVDPSSLRQLVLADTLGWEYCLGQFVLVDVSSLGHVILAGNCDAKLARTSGRMHVDPARTGYARDLPKTTCPSRRRGQVILVDPSSLRQLVLAVVCRAEPARTGGRRILGWEYPLGRIILVDVSSLGHAILTGNYNAKPARTSRQDLSSPGRTIPADRTSGWKFPLGYLVLAGVRAPVTCYYSAHSVFVLALPLALIAHS